MQTWVIVALVVFVGLVLTLQLATYWRARRVLGRAAPDTGSVDGSAAGERRRIYYFFAEHCGPCRAMTPLVAQLQQTHHHLIKVDVAQSLALARAFGVAATPSFVLVEDDTIRQVRLGGMSEKRLRHMLEAG
ncbi:MAG TPA: thioredoxin family protein [Sulfuriferula sp.]|nr:thioredoxin family protein [Sulfuriferula sp.]